VQQNPGHLLPPFSIYTDKTDKSLTSYL